MLMLSLLLLVVAVTSLRRGVVITGCTGVLGNALVKSLTLTSSPSSEMTIYIGYRDIHKLQELHSNDPILSQYKNSNNNAITLCPTNINLDDDNIDLSLLNDNDELILINNAAVFMNGNDFGN